MLLLQLLLLLLLFLLFLLLLLLLLIVFSSDHAELILCSDPRPIPNVKKLKEKLNITLSLPSSLLPALPEGLPPRPDLIHLPRCRMRLPLLHPHRCFYTSLPPSLPYPGSHKATVILLKRGGGGAAAGVEPEGGNEDLGTLKGEALLIAFHLEHGAVVGHHGKNETAGTKDTEDVVDQRVVRFKGSIGLEGSVGAFGLRRDCGCVSVWVGESE